VQQHRHGQLPPASPASQDPAAVPAPQVRIQERTGLSKVLAFGIVLGCIAAFMLTSLAAVIWLCGGFPQRP
jgi:hypothetical protein